MSAAWSDVDAAVCDEASRWGIVSSEWAHVLRTWRETEGFCAWCGLHFNAVRNIGQLRCMQHRVSDPDYTERRWPCCGRPAPARSATDNPHSYAMPVVNGCTASDHQLARVSWRDEDMVPLPAYIEPKLPLPVQPRAVVRHDLELGIKYVSRYDYEGARRVATWPRID